jgi:hypothetical protein
VTIPVQGLRNTPTTVEIMRYGVVAPMVHKGIQFGKDLYDEPTNSMKNNKNTLRDALKDYNFYDEESPLSQILPKFITVLKNLYGDKVC